jgi:hypothetical protein
MRSAALLADQDFSAAFAFQGGVGQPDTLLEVTRGRSR